MSEPNTEVTVFFCRHSFPPNSNTCEYCGETLLPEVTTPSEMKLPHSPLPWAEDERAVVAANGRQVFFFDDRSPQGRADRALIISAVNRQAELVEALKELFAAAEWYRREGHEDAYARWIRAEDAVKALTKPTE